MVKIVMSVSLKYLNESVPSDLFPTGSVSSSGAVMSEGAVGAQLREQLHWLMAQEGSLRHKSVASGEGRIKLFIGATQSQELLS